MITSRFLKWQSFPLAPRWSRSRLLAGVIIAVCGVFGMGAPALAQGRPPQGGPPGGPPPGAPMRPEMPRPPKPLKVEVVLEAVEKQHRSADVNRDGFLTKDEIRSQIAQMADAAISNRFKAIDADRNGTIDKAEFAAWQKSMGSLALSDTAAAGSGGALVPETIPFGTDLGLKGEMLRLLIEPLSVTVVVNSDQNYDGQVDVAELRQYQRRRFDTFDENADGFLTFDEMPKPALAIPSGMPLMPPPQDDADRADEVVPPEIFQS